MRRTGEESAESARIVLGLLDAVEHERAPSQRLLASELGIALGLVNAYLRRCVKKGLLKVSSAPARRYVYYLTPQGFAEKSRLTIEYLSSSFGFFRQAKLDCLEQFQRAKADGVKKAVIAGQSDLAEVAALCAMEHTIKIVGVVQRDPRQKLFVGLPVYGSFGDVPHTFEAVMVTALVDVRQICDQAVNCVGGERVYVPKLLRIASRRASKAS